MSHQTTEFASGSGIRVAQGLALGHCLVGGVLDGIAQVQRQRAAEELSAVDALSAEVYRLRRLLAGAQAEARQASAEVSTLERAVDGERARADRAEANLGRLVEAVRAGHVRA